MKKVILSGFTLLSVLALVACSSGNKESSTSGGKSEAGQTSLEASKVKEIKKSTATYLTDAEIEAIQNLGDYKKAFKSLMDTYVTDFDNLISQLPKDAQQSLVPQRDQMVETFDMQYKTLEEQYAASGVSEDSAIPTETRESLVSTLKQARDMLKSTMETVYNQSQDLLNQ